MDGHAGGSSAEDLAALVRRADPDRFFCGLFAPAARRDALWVLYAFNHELARALDVTTQPLPALIRLQWWREVVEGAPRRHAVAEPLSAALRAGVLDRDDLLALIEARETEVDAIEAGAFDSISDWQAWLLAGAGGLAVAAGRALGAAEPSALRPYGAGYGAAGALRTAALLARRGRCLLPADSLGDHGLTPAEAIAAPDGAAFRAARAALAGIAAAALPPPCPMSRAVIAAALPAVFARRDLHGRCLMVQPRGLGDRLAVTWAALRRRV